MSFSKSAGALSIALSTTDEKKAKTQAKTFFTYINKMGINFNALNYTLFHITKEEAIKVSTLAGKIIPGLTSDEEVVKVEITIPVKVDAKPGTVEVKKHVGSARDICYSIFSEIDMDDAKIRRATIDLIVEQQGIKKTVVQSYASNFRKAK